jgi:hypothetical protein
MPERIGHMIKICLKLLVFLALFLLIIDGTHNRVAHSAQTTSASPAGPSEGIGAVYSHSGLLFVVNSRNAHFTIELDGSDIKTLPSEKISYWLIDGILIETYVVDKRQIGPDALTLSGEDLLLRHMRWESEHIAKQNGWPYTAPERIKIKLSSQKSAIGWIIDASGKLTVLGEKIGKMVFVTAEVGDKIFVMTSPVPVAGGHMAAFEKMAKDLEAIKISSVPLDIKEVADHIKKENKEGVRCSKRSK